jgi:uncharacterized protein (TIGR00369 family)
MNEVVATKALERALAEYDRNSGGFFLERFLGVELSFDGEVCVLSLEIEDFMFNSGGTLHGGVIAFVLDSAAGSLFKRVNGSGYTLESKIQYLRSLGRGRATCNARFLKRGRLVSFVEVVLSSTDGKPAAIATSTWHTA